MNAINTLSKLNLSDSKDDMNFFITSGFGSISSNQVSDSFRTLVDVVDLVSLDVNLDVNDEGEIIDKDFSAPVDFSGREASNETFKTSFSALGIESIRVLSPLETQVAASAYTKLSTIPISSESGSSLLFHLPSISSAEPSGELQAVTLETKDISRDWVFKASLDKKMSAEHMGQKLGSLLADKVLIQYNAKTPIATIRLDPPELGKIDLLVRVDGGKVQVQVHASSQATRESLQLTSDKLRDELLNQNFLNVDVQISNEHFRQRHYQNNYDDSNEINVVSNTKFDHGITSEVSSLNNELARI